jgi:hypothetical protein
MKLGKKSLFHIGTGVDIRPQKRSRKITAIIQIRNPNFIFYRIILFLWKIELLKTAIYNKILSNDM